METTHYSDLVAISNCKLRNIDGNNHITLHDYVALVAVTASGIIRHHQLAMNTMLIITELKS